MISPSNLDDFGLNLTEFNINLVYFPVYTATPITSSTFFRTDPFNNKLSSDKGNVSPWIEICPLKELRYGVGL